MQRHSGRNTRGLGIILLTAVAVRVAQAGDSGLEGLRASSTREFAPGLAPMRLHVSGNELLNARDETVWLRGVNVASLEWSNQGEHMDEAFHHAIGAWKANVIRMPLAQDRWFGKAPHQTDEGESYRAVVDRLVGTCAASGAYIDLDLHWSDTGRWSNEGAKLAQHPMPDHYSVPFWRDVATRYKNYPNVIFGLYNEPHDVSWTIWHEGGTVVEKPSKRDTNQAPSSYEGVGLQKLYDTVRATGAENVVTVSGLDWGYDLGGVLDGHEIQGTNIVYETHPYPFKTEWDKRFGRVSGAHPVFMGEWGGGTKDLDYGHRLMAYARGHHLHWTAWCFHPTCGPPLLKNWDFDPNDFGKLVREALTEP